MKKCLCSSCDNHMNNGTQENNMGQKLYGKPRKPLNDTVISNNDKDSLSITENRFKLMNILICKALSFDNLLDERQGIQFSIRDPMK